MSFSYTASFLGFSGTHVVQLCLFRDLTESWEEVTEEVAEQIGDPSDDSSDSSDGDSGDTSGGSDGSGGGGGGGGGPSIPPDGPLPFPDLPTAGSAVGFFDRNCDGIKLGMTFNSLLEALNYPGVLSVYYNGECLGNGGTPVVTIEDL